MATAAKYTTYGKVSFLEKVGQMASVILYLRESYPPVVLFTNFEPYPQRHNILRPRLDVQHLSPFHETNRYKAWQRIANETFFRHLMHWLNIRQMQWLNPKTTREVYEECAKENKFPILINDLDSDARLLWLGGRRTDKVILCVHSG